MNSFYGGKKGDSFIIAKTFKYVSMDNLAAIAEETEYLKDFRQEVSNGNLTAIELLATKRAWENENCMVSAFKQGPDYAEVHFDEYVLINSPNKSDQDNGKIYKRGYDYTNEFGGAIYLGTIVGPAGPASELILKGYNQITSSDTQNSEIQEGEYTVENRNLVPGKNGNTYNDSIKWKTFTIKDANSTQAEAHIGFQIPYHVIDFTAKSVVFNDKDSNDIAAIERIDNQEHPFYEQWQLNLPIPTITIEESDELIEGSSNRGKKKFVFNNLQYLNDGSSTVLKKEIGDYNIIEDISQDEEGDILITYSAKETVNFSINFIKRMEVDDNYNLLAYYSDENKNDPNSDHKVLGKIGASITMGKWYALSELGLSDNATEEQIVSALNNNQNIPKQNTVITVGSNQLFAWNGIDSTWIRLDTARQDAMFTFETRENITNNSGSYENKKSKLKTGGFIFIKETLPEVNSNGS